MGGRGKHFPLPNSGVTPTTGGRRMVLRMPVQRVAEALLFSNAANFATAFRRWTGATPSEYRSHTPAYAASAER
jgi:AraC-like DNA-binding protein